MKRRILIPLLILLLCTLFFVGCDISDIGSGETPLTVDVTYVLNNGEADITETVTTLIGIVKTPTPKKENYIFSGWYQNKALTRPFDINTALKSDLTLYAAWTFDYETYVNSAKNLLLPATVKIDAYTYTSGIFSTTITSSRSGSGVVVYKDNKYYYVLTNNHVTYLTAGGNKAYTVTDIYEKQYEATLLYASAEYDLSLLRIKIDAMSTPLTVASFATEDALPGDICMAIGSPGGIRNSMTLGKIKLIRNVELSENEKDSSNVTFDVLWHTAPIDHGSSGGALFGDDFTLIGINYAAAVENDSFYEGYTVPISRVREFLRLTVLKEYF